MTEDFLVHNKNPQFSAKTPGLNDSRKDSITNAKSLLSHARFRSIDLNIVDSITDKSYRSISQPPDAD